MFAPNISGFPRSIFSFIGMNTVEPIDQLGMTDHDLLQVQLQIARRADELVQAGCGSDRDCWLQAEREVLGEANCAVA